MTDKDGAAPAGNEQLYRGLKIHAIASLHEHCMSLIESSAVPRGSSVLDLGAGEGAFTQRLLDAGFQVVGAELESSRFKVDAPCLEVDLNRDFHNKCDQTFDMVVAIEIIEHLHNPRHFISNCLQLLKTDGLLLVTSPNTESWLSRIRFLRDGHFLWFDEQDYEAYGHLTPIFTWQVKQICREHSAEVVQVSNTNDGLLQKRLGNTLTARLKNKAFYLTALNPFMKGQKEGEISIYLIRKIQPMLGAGPR